jgi:histidine triad (HIT) family protein
MDCIFCKIAKGEIPAKIIYEDDQVVAFDDLRPQAPFHKLIIPRKHIATLNDFDKEDAKLAGQMMLVAQKIARDCGIAESGYRVVVNTNRDSGQEVFHIHFHLLGGRQLHWPPG